jgi:hypothetical protein
MAMRVKKHICSVPNVTRHVSFSFFKKKSDCHERVSSMHVPPPWTRTIEILMAYKAPLQVFVYLPASTVRSVTKHVTMM